MFVCGPVSPTDLSQNSIYSVHDDSKDKPFELELSWVCEETGNLHKFVPKDLQEEAENYAKKALEEDEDMSDDDE